MERERRGEEEAAVKCRTEDDISPPPPLPPSQWPSRRRRSFCGALERQREKDLQSTHTHKGGDTRGRGRGAHALVQLATKAFIFCTLRLGLFIARPKQLEKKKEIKMTFGGLDKKERQVGSAFELRQEEKKKLKS